MACFWLHNTIRVEPHLLPFPHQLREDFTYQPQTNVYPNDLWDSPYCTDDGIRLFTDDDCNSTYYSALRKGECKTNVRFRDEHVKILKNARHLAIVAPYQLQSALVEILISRTDILSLSFHPYGDFEWSGTAERVLPLILDPLRLGDTVTMDDEGLFIPNDNESKATEILSEAIQGRQAENEWYYPGGSAVERSLAPCRIALSRIE